MADKSKEKEESFKDKIGYFEKEVQDSIDEGVKRTKSFFGKVFKGILLLLFLTIVGYFLYANYTYSEGTRAGNLIKVSKKGYVFKTYEGQLKLGGIDLHNEDEGLSDTWSFSVTDDSVVKELEKYQGTKVILHYKEINQSMPWQGETNYFVTSVERAE